MFAGQMCTNIMYFVTIYAEFQSFPVMPRDFLMKKGGYGNELLILIRGVARSVPDSMELASQEYEIGR